VQGNTVSVERVINAPAAQIFALIADAGKHSSVDGSATVDHSSLGVLPSQAGAPGRRTGGRSQPLSLGSMPKQAEDGMRATLERIAALLEP